MSLFLVLPLAVQGVLMVVDEACFHRVRRLPRWERIGHPLDTLSVLACYAYVLWVPFSAGARSGYIALAAFSTLFVTKDEFVHNKQCSGREQWIHAVLFVLHPVVFLVLAIAWPDLNGSASTMAFAIQVQFAGAILFLLYQTLYWNLPWKPAAPRRVA